MEFRILYCGPCGYRERAEALDRELRERYGASVTVEEGGFGQFDVFLDGEIVASKGGRLRRMLIHGAPPESRIREAIDRHVTVRAGDACELPVADDQAGASTRGSPRGASTRRRWCPSPRSAP